MTSNMQRAIHTEAIVGVALALALSVSVAPRFAICSGPGGHLAIEPLYAPCCRAGSDGRSDHTLSDCAGGACRDTPLNGDPILLRFNSDQLQAHAVATVATALRVLTPSIRADALHPSRGGIGAPLPPREQRTTILVC